jgi:DNA-binding XRE family transcriptional regulator
MVRAVSEDAARDINAELSNRLAEERENRGVSKRTLADDADIDRATVKFIEKPEENPTVLNVIRYALALKLDVGKILSECLQPYLAQETTKPKPKAKAKKK